MNEELRRPQVQNGVISERKEMFFPIFDDEYICQSNVAIDVDPDSRDSGISVGTSMENDSVIDFASTYPTKLLGPQSSSSELDDRMDELAIEESLVDLSAFEYQTEQEFRKKRVKNVALTYRKPLGEITNSSQIDESPKSRLKTTWKTYVSRSQLNTVVRQFGRQTSCVETSSTVVRKRNINDNTDNNVKRRAITQIMNDENTEKTVVQSQKSTLLTRVHSTSSLENGRYAKGPRDDQLPKVWHVEYSLDVVSKPFVDSVAFKSISGSTLSELISTMNNDEFQKKYMLVDCRYPYEYSGGHIKNAINLFDPTLVPDMFYPEKFDATNARIPIFYCEYSQKRGPSMAAALRQYDRQRNESRYPEIDYKEIYLLDRGYKKFFLDDAFTQLCEPPCYVPMIDSTYKNELKRFQMHKSKSFCTGTSSLRESSSTEVITNRRGRLKFEVKNVESDSKRRPRRRELFGSPLSVPQLSPLSSSPSPTSSFLPIPPPNFS